MKRELSQQSREREAYATYFEGVTCCSNVLFSLSIYSSIIHLFLCCIKLRIHTLSPLVQTIVLCLSHSRMF